MSCFFIFILNKYALEAVVLIQDENGDRSKEAYDLVSKACVTQIIELSYNAYVYFSFSIQI